MAMLHSILYHGSNHILLHAGPCSQDELGGDTAGSGAPPAPRTAGVVTAVLLLLTHTTPAAAQGMSGRSELAEEVQGGGVEGRQGRGAVAGAEGEAAHPSSQQGSGGQATSHPLVVAGYESGSIALWDLRAPGQPLCLHPQPHTEPVLCLGAAPTQDRLFSGSADNLLHSWVLREGRAHRERGVQGGETHSKEGAQSGEMHREGGVQGMGAHKQGGWVLKQKTSHILPQPGMSDITWRLDGRVVATAGWDAKVGGYMVA